VSVLWVVLAASPALVLPGEPPLTFGPRVIPAASVSDAKDCGGCHLDIAEQWRSSTHALASFSNPLYRVSVERLRADRGPKASQACGRCHDVALLADGVLATDVSPDDARAHAGVSCTTCHSSVHATRDGNGSLTLRADEAFPSRPEDSTLERHRARVASSTLRTAELCGACHRSFLAEESGNAAAFFGMDDYGAWQSSAFNADTSAHPEVLAPQDCRGCHMPQEAAVLGDVAAKHGLVPSHRFLGAHTTLAAMRGDAAQVARAQAFLKGAATVELAAARRNRGEWLMPASLARPSAGDEVEFDVVLFNERTGHRFPGGVLDNQGTTVKVALRTASGRTLAVSDEHQLRSEVVDAQGQPLLRRQTQEFVAAAWNHTLPPRDARVARFRFVLPASLGEGDFPLVAEARLEHRARSAQLMALACEESRAPRGQAFAAGAKKYLGVALEPCVAQPVTTVAATQVTLTGLASAERWDTAYHRGLGLSVSLQEYLDEAEEALHHARGLAAGDEIGQTEWALGVVAGRRGQLALALEHLERAQAQLGPTAAVLRARGDASAQVWRWSEAAAAWRAALQRAPNALGLWQSLAMAEASLGHPREALAAAQGGLALLPRDGDCLRVQALALRQLGRAESTSALDAALTWRAPDDGPQAKARCSALVPGCAQRRNPVPVFEAHGAAPGAPGRGAQGGLKGPPGDGGGGASLVGSEGP
jgi:tetratricopeptide (TPR) repeat protein